MRLKDSEIIKVAQDIEPYTTELKIKQGYITNDDYRRLSRDHAHHTIVSDRSCQMVDDYLTGERYTS